MSTISVVSGGSSFSEGMSTTSIDISMVGSSSSGEGCVLRKALPRSVLILNRGNGFYGDSSHWLLSQYLQAPEMERPNDIALGIVSLTMSMTLMQCKLPVPPASNFNDVAADIGRRWVKKAQTWPLDTMETKRQKIGRRESLKRKAMSLKAAVYPSKDIVIE